MIKGKTLFMNSIASIIPARIKSIRERFRVLRGERFVSSENIEIPVIAPAFPPADGLWIIEGRKMLRISSVVTIIRRYRIKEAIIYERGDGYIFEWSILSKWTGDKKLARRVKKLIKSFCSGGITVREKHCRLARRGAKANKHRVRPSSRTFHRE